MPNLTAGVPGWTSIIEFVGAEHGASGGSASGSPGYPTRAQPVVQGVHFGLQSNEGHAAPTLAWVLTDPAVAAVRVGDRVVRTLNSSALPAGDRAAVYLLPPQTGASSAALQVGGTHYENRSRAGLSVLTLAARRKPSADQNNGTLPIPLDRYGTPIPTYGAQEMSNSPGTYWRARTKLTSGLNKAGIHGPARPSTGVCNLAEHGVSGLIPEWGRTISRILGITDAPGELFVSCVNTEYELAGRILDVGVLLDARYPGQVLGALPGTAPVRGIRGFVNDNATSLTARRVGNAWIVVEGLAAVKERIRILRATRVSGLASFKSIPAHRLADRTGG